MLEVYITKLEKGLESVAPTVMDKENFLLIIGSLFFIRCCDKMDSMASLWETY